MLSSISFEWLRDVITKSIANHFQKNEKRLKIKLHKVISQYYFRETYIKPEDQDEALESEDTLKDEEAAKKAAYKELKMQVGYFTNGVQVVNINCSDDFEIFVSFLLTQSENFSN